MNGYRKAPQRKRSARLNPLALKKVSPRTLSQKRQNLTVNEKAKSFLQKLWPLNWKRRRPFSWKRFLIWTAGVIAVLFLFLAGAFAYYIGKLPNPNTITKQPTQSTVILDRNGKSLYNFYGNQNRTLVTGDKIAPSLKQAVVATEDADFYHHHGFDIKGVLRAIYGRLTGRRAGGGGSTITQQYVKNALLTPEGGVAESSIRRKFEELILSVEVEQRYTKDEILTGYLNQIPMGSSNYGMETASENYFGKDAKDLTLSESATLAAMIQAPSYYSPYGSHTDELFARKNYVLDRMASTKAVTQAQADAAKKDGPSSENATFSKAKNFVAQHFVFYVRQKLIEYIGGDPADAERQLDESGYTVTTSLDLDAQNMAQAILAEMGPNVVKTYRASNAALTAVDPATGEIIAMVGSIDYEDSKSGNTNFANALLQPGSSFKPFVYATAFDKDHKYSPSSITYDLVTDFGGGYKPTDYDLKQRGPMTNREALAQSLNIPAVKNLALAGVNNSIDTAKRLGITSLTEPDKYGLSLVLGSGEVRPVEMAGAYAGFANGGMFNPLRPILKIVKNSKVVKDFTKTAAQKAVEPEIAYEITSILSDNGARAPIFGTHNSMTLSDRPVAAKTGTTNNNRDAWTVGYTPQISVAVWVGNNEPNKTMTSGADGSYVAAPIWKAFMEKYLKGKPVMPFVRPGGLTDLAVDKLSGKIPTDQSPPDQHVTDIFASWQLPAARFGADHQTDDVHIKVKVDKVTGKLANALTPPDQIEERYYFNVHSEMPDNSNWEIPVQAWAKNNGGNSPPTDTDDDQYNDGNLPTVSFVTPLNGATVNGPFNIEVSPGGLRPIKSAEFFINGVLAGTATQAPWKVASNADSLPAGSSVIAVKVTNDLGLTRTEQVTVTKDQSDTTPPGPVTGLTSTNGHVAAHSPIHLSWANPADIDLSKVIIYQSSSPGSIGTAIRTIAATPGSAGSADITGLGLGTYYFTIHTVDATGNESQVNVTTVAQMLP